jgi:uroporphyrin-III C-methyltransferase / precorrin-2 dehydrogenase / sirohydrochlorin ferrochelatase
MSSGLPLTLDVHGRRVVAVGGGPVSARRVAAFVAAGAHVVVVAPDLCEDLHDLVDAGLVTWRPSDFEPTDLDDAWLAHTATGSPDADSLVAQAAQQRRVWCVCAGDAGRGTARTPAVAKTAGVTVAVTAERDPRRAMAVRNAVQTSLETGTLPLRHRRRRGRGSVALVGGGPGDPGLITTRGRRLLAMADVVVVDRLGPRLLLDELDPDVEVVEAGKAPHAHTMTQAQINDLIVERALAGQRVVRLKGGDPFVLGRGGEEVAACRDAGVPVTVVPGVTSAVAVPAAAGIPVTHRGIASEVTVVSGHDGPLDWAGLAGAAGTLVLLMGVARLDEITEHLMAHGKDATTPVAVVESGTTRTQRTTVGTLADIARRAAAVGVRSPAVIVVGDVVALRTKLGDLGLDAVGNPADV